MGGEVRARDVAMLLLYTPDGRILFQHRDGGAPTYPNTWAFFGGGLKPGETPEQALAREAGEELGYRPQAPLLFRVQPYRDTLYERRGRFFCFLEAYRANQPLTLGEGDRMAWFTIAETAGLPFPAVDRPILDHAARALAQLLPPAPPPG